MLLLHVYQLFLWVKVSSTHVRMCVCLSWTPEAAHSVRLEKQPEDNFRSMWSFLQHDVWKRCVTLSDSRRGERQETRGGSSVVKCILKGNSSIFTHQSVFAGLLKCCCMYEAFCVSRGSSVKADKCPRVMSPEATVPSLEGSWSCRLLVWIWHKNLWVWSQKITELNRHLKLH